MPPDLAQTLSRLSRKDEPLSGLDRVERATSRQSKFDADIAKAMVRILRGEERGIARGPGHELRTLLTKV